jgi:hypothetical protein
LCKDGSSCQGQKRGHESLFLLFAVLLLGLLLGITIGLSLLVILLLLGRSLLLLDGVLGLLLSLLGLRSRSRLTVGHLGDELLDYIDSRSGATWGTGQDLAGLVDDENPAGGALGRLLEANGANQRGVGVAEKRVGQVLLLLEGSVGLGRVGGQAVDGESTGRQRLVGVSEEAGLRGAYIGVTREFSKCQKYI